MDLILSIIVERLIGLKTHLKVASVIVCGQPVIKGISQKTPIYEEKVIHVK
jgi:hypothetical protein